MNVQLPAPPGAYLEYEAAEARLFRVEGTTGRVEIPLTPLQHRLIAHMAARNHAIGGRPALCTHEELIRAIWGTEPGHTPQELAWVIHGVRRRVVPGSPGCSPLVNERGRGYRLITRSPGSAAAGASATPRVRRLRGYRPTRAATRWPTSARRTVGVGAAPITVHTGPPSGGPAPSGAPELPTSHP